METTETVEAPESGGDQWKPQRLGRPVETLETGLLLHVRAHES